MNPKALRPLIPSLEDSDRLSRDEFERRYHVMPKRYKAELIEGVVYVASRVHAIYACPRADLVAWLGNYRAMTPGTDGAGNATDRMDDINEPQPDAMLFINVERSKTFRLGADGCFEGSPELIAEIAASSKNKDLGPKRRAFARNGVQEYLVWRVEDDEIDWFTLQAGEYVHMNRDQTSITRSQVFPGLWLDVPAMIERNLSRVLSVLSQGLATEEHSVFLAKLESMPRRDVTG